MPNSSVDKIKERLGIAEVVSSYLKLVPAGKNLKAKCPFHNEKTPSFFISPDRGTYYCFGCGAKGDIFTFVEEFEGLDFRGALKLLADRAGVVLEKFNPEKASEKEKIYQVMEEATKFFRENLSKNLEVFKYLKDRGLTDDSVSSFQIGFAKDDWRELYFHLQKKGFKNEEMEKAGLIKKADRDYYDRFRNRIMFPISDTSGRVIAFSGRIWKDDLPAGRQAESPKYLNSPETLIFSKSSVLYGLDRAKEFIRKNNFAVLVEGQFDLILSHQAGFRNTVATSGTALSDSTVSKENTVSNLGLLRRLSGNLVLAFDADKAGIRAAERASKIALSLGMDVKVAALPEGDPADIISRNGIDAWREAIRNSKHIIEFLLNKILNQPPKDSRYLGNEIREKVLSYVAAVESEIEKAHFLKKISEAAGIPEEALRGDLRKIERETKSDQTEIKEAEESENKLFRKDYIQRKIIGILLWQKDLPQKQRILKVEELVKELAEVLKIKPEEVWQKTKEQKEDLLFEAEVFYEEDINLQKDVLELLANLREESWKEELAEKMKELRLVEEKGKRKKADKILMEIDQLGRKIQAIKNNQNR